MGVAREFQTGFDAGFVDKEFASREDLELYRRSLILCDNWEISYSGSLRKRRGTERLTEYNQSGQTDVGTRLEVFAFDEANTWLVDLKPGEILIRDQDGDVVATLDDASIANWLTTNTIPELAYDQLLDTAVLTHEDFWPKLIRRSGSSWNVEDFAYATDGALTNPRVWGAWHKFLDTNDIYMQPFARSGSTWMQAKVEDTVTGDVNATITGIAKGTTTVITATAHGLSVGHTVTLSNIVDNGPNGDLEDALNDNQFPIIAVTTDTFTIPEDTSGLTNTYSSGGDADYTDGMIGTPWFTSSMVGETFKWRGKRWSVDALVTGPTFDHLVECTIIETLDEDVRLHLPDSTPNAASEFFVGEYVAGNVTSTTGWVSAIDTGNNTIDVNVEQGIFKAPTTDPGTVEINNSEQVYSMEIPSKSHFIQWKEQATWLGGGIDPVASLDWEEPAWSVTRGYPGAVAFHSGRLWFAGTTDLPNYVWSSKALDFFNFDVGTGGADDSIQYPIISGAVKRILHLVSGQYLCIFTDSAEYWVPESETNPITPGAFSPRLASNYGTKRTFAPFLLRGDPVFLQQKGQVLRHFRYDGQYTLKYQSEIMSGWASSLIANPVKGFASMGRAERGEEYFWLVNGTGTVVQCTVFPDNRMAYSTWSHGMGSNLCLSGCATDSHVFFLWKYGNWNFIDRIVSAYDNTALLDYQRTYTSGTPTATFTVHADYNSLVVDVVGWDEDDDVPCYYLGQFTVSNNQINLGNPIWEKISVGYAYDSEAETVPVNVLARDGATRMVPKKLVSWAPTLIDTYAINVNDQTIEASQDLANPSAPPSPLNTEPRRWQLGYDTTQTVRIASYTPLAAEIAALSLEVQY